MRHVEWEIKWRKQETYLRSHGQQRAELGFEPWSLIQSGCLEEIGNYGQGREGLREGEGTRHGHLTSVFESALVREAQRDALQGTGSSSLRCRHMIQAVP